MPTVVNDQVALRDQDQLMSGIASNLAHIREQRKRIATQMNDEINRMAKLRARHKLPNGAKTTITVDGLVKRENDYIPTMGKIERKATADGNRTTVEVLKDSDGLTNVEAAKKAQNEILNEHRGSAVKKAVDKMAERAGDKTSEGLAEEGKKTASEMANIDPTKQPFAKYDPEKFVKGATELDSDKGGTGTETDEDKAKDVAGKASEFEKHSKSAKMAIGAGRNEHFKYGYSVEKGKPSAAIEAENDVKTTQVIDPTYEGETEFSAADYQDMAERERIAKPERGVADLIGTEWVKQRMTERTHLNELNAKAGTFESLKEGKFKTNIAPGTDKTAFDMEVGAASSTNIDIRSGNASTTNNADSNKGMLSYIGPNGNPQNLANAVDEAGKLKVKIPSLVVDTWAKGANRQQKVDNFNTKFGYANIKIDMHGQIKQGDQLLAVWNDSDNRITYQPGCPQQYIDQISGVGASSTAGVQSSDINKTTKGK